ncbi:MAG: cupin domain-containing protein [Ensifer adhaerens]
MITDYRASFRAARIGPALSGYRASILHVPAGAASGAQPHKPGTREIFHILSGRVEVNATQETVTLETGDTVIRRVDSEHWFANVGDEPLDLVARRCDGTRSSRGARALRD